MGTYFNSDVCFSAINIYGHLHCFKPIHSSSLATNFSSHPWLEMSRYQKNKMKMMKFIFQLYWEKNPSSSNTTTLHMNWINVYTGDIFFQNLLYDLTMVMTSYYKGNSFFQTLFQEKKTRLSFLVILISSQHISANCYNQQLQSRPSVIKITPPPPHVKSLVII